MIHTGEPDFWPRSIYHILSVFKLLLKLLPKLRPGVRDVEEQFLAKLEWASNLFHSNVERFKASGVPCWAGGGMESPLQEAH